MSSIAENRFPVRNSPSEEARALAEALAELRARRAAKVRAASAVRKAVAS